MALRIFISIWCFLGLFSLQAQDFSEADKTSYELYVKQDWSSLMELSIANKKAGLDGYYLNIRGGIAAYNEGALYTAASFLKAALKNRVNDGLALDYLRGVYLRLAWYQEAEEIRAMMLRLGLKPKGKWQQQNVSQLQYLYKQSDLETQVGDLWYAAVDHSVAIKPRWQFAVAVSMLGQERYWGGFQSYQWYVNPSYYMGSGWNIGLSFQGIAFDGTIDFQQETNFQETDEQIGLDGQIYTGDVAYLSRQFYTGTSKQNIRLFGLHTEKRWGRLQTEVGLSLFDWDRDVQSETTDSLSWVASYQFEEETVTYPGDTVYVSTNLSDSTGTVWQSEVKAFYTPAILGDRIRLGGTFGYVSDGTANGQNYGLAISYTQNKHSVSVMWLQQNHQLFRSREKNRIVDDSQHALEQSWSVYYQYYVRKKWTCAVSLAMEDRVDEIGQSYQMKSFWFSVSYRW